jgi:peptidoglycan/xylan/chitin deacetylase (PgdA/CDA1 family)
VERRRVTALAAVLLLTLVVLLVAILGGGRSGAKPGPAAERRAAVQALIAVGLRPRPPTAAERLRRREGAALDGVLAYTSFISRGSPNKREVALTFDDGPGPYTDDVLRVLAREHVHATFFAIGEQAADFGSALTAAVRDGEVVGDHTQTHPMMADLSPRDQRREIEDQEVLVESRGVPRERLYRPPYGSYDAATVAILKRRRMLMVLWDVDTEDYPRPGVDAIARTAVDGARPGSIVLMHDGGGDRSQTVAALPAIIRGLRAKGLRPVTLPQLVLDDPPPRTQGLPPNLSGG